MTPAAATVLFRNVRAPCHSDASDSVGLVIQYVAEVAIAGRQVAGNEHDHVAPEEEVVLRELNPPGPFHTPSVARPPSSTRTGRGVCVNNLEAKSVKSVRSWCVNAGRARCAARCASCAPHASLSRTRQTA